MHALLIQNLSVENDKFYQRQQTTTFKSKAFVASFEFNTRNR